MSDSIDFEMPSDLRRNRLAESRMRSTLWDDCSRHGGETYYYSKVSNRWEKNSHNFISATLSQERTTAHPLEGRAATASSMGPRLIWELPLSRPVRARLSLH